jgi:hypothetical protein
LVKGGHELVRALDAAGVAPLAAMWVQASEMDTWKLWIVPHPSIKDKREFYRRIAEIVTKHRVELAGIDASDTEMVSASHPAMAAMARIVHMPALGVGEFHNNLLDGYYLPNGIVLRMNLAQPVA